MRSRKTNGRDFEEVEKRVIFEKGDKIPGWSESEYRKDVCGAVIRFSMYGDTTPGGNGWEIDHIIPKSKGGSSDYGNLQPLQWENNRSKGDDYPAYPSSYCIVSWRN